MRKIILKKKYYKAQEKCKPKPASIKKPYFSDQYLASAVARYCILKLYDNSVYEINKNLKCFGEDSSKFPKSFKHEDHNILLSYADCQISSAQRSNSRSQHIV